MLNGIFGQKNRSGMPAIFLIHDVGPAIAVCGLAAAFSRAFFRAGGMSMNKLKNTKKYNLHT
jgi:hypothetical protein